MGVSSQEQIGASAILAKPRYHFVVVGGLESQKRVPNYRIRGLVDENDFPFRIRFLQIGYRPVELLIQSRAVIGITIVTRNIAVIAFEGEEVHVAVVEGKVVLCGSTDWSWD